jgi:phage terminase large subunit GpA-like protein
MLSTPIHSTLINDPRIWRDAKAEIIAAGREALKVMPRLTMTEIAEKHRFFPSETSNIQGRYDSNLTPYTREILERLHPDDPCQVLVYEAAAQAGAKTTIAENWMLAVMGGYFPARMLCVLDTQENVEDFAKDNLDTMIDHCPLLMDRVRDPVKTRKGESMTGKWFPGGRLRLAGAMSPRKLARMAAKYVTGDEIDRWAASVGYEGHGTDVILGRQTTFGQDRKAYFASTPTLEHLSEIHTWFLRGDQRYYHVPCPHCGEMQKLEWRDGETNEYRLIWTPGHPDEAHYICRHCGKAIEEQAKNLFLPAGVWNADHPEIGRGLIRSYNLNCLYAPLGYFSWPDLAAEWERANDAKRHGDLEPLKTFINIRLAWVFSPPSEAVAAHELEPYLDDTFGDSDVLPAGVQVVTMAADVQGGEGGGNARIEILWVGWGVGMEMWLLDHVIIPGEASSPDVWRQVSTLRDRRWTKPDGSTVAAAVCCIDRGYAPDDVLSFTTRNKARRVLAVRGIEGKPNDPIWTRKASTRNSDKIKNAPYYNIPVVAAKEILNSILRTTLALKPGESGAKVLHIPRSLVAKLPDSLEQITNEKRILTRLKNGGSHVAWVKKYETARNEIWDCMVYNLAGLKSLVLAGLNLNPVVVPVSDSAPKPATEPTPEPAPMPVVTPLPVSGDNRKQARPVSGYKFDRSRSMRRR